MIPNKALRIATVALMLSCGAGCSSAPGTHGIGTWNVGNPEGACSLSIPTNGLPSDLLRLKTVVGTGTPASCTDAQLRGAIATGGIITFNCGESPVTIPVTATLDIPIDRDTIIDGGKKVTLDGQHRVRIMSFDSPQFRENEHRLTLQHIALINGKTTSTEMIPVRPSPCSQGWNDGEGGAVYMQDGNLTVIDSVFTGNQAAPLGPDTGGGAIYVMASKYGALIVGSTFIKNTASNAGAVGALHADLRIYNSLFMQNAAVGNGANNDDSSRCLYINNNQHEIGSGGNGGAIYSDGKSVSVLLCGDKIEDNSAGANAEGGGLFFTSNDMRGTLSIIDTEMTGNTGRHWTVVSTGKNRDAGTAVGTNCKSFTMRNSSLQGLP